MEDPPASQPTVFKVVLLGEGAVGKTSLWLRYIEDKYNSKHESTLQAAFLSKKLNLSGQRITLNIWDTAGQERFHALGPIYYRDSNGALLVYDITDEDSFIKVKNWVKELRKMLGNGISLGIVGNKIDLEKDRAVSIETAEEYATSVGASHFLTSAKFNKGVDEAFLELSKKMLEKAATLTLTRDKQRSSISSRRNVVVVDDEVESSMRSRGCCS